MHDTEIFARLTLFIAVAGLVAVLSNRITDRLRVPAPAIVLVATAILVKVIPSLHAPQLQTVQRLVTVALLAILFDGGMHIGWRRLRSAAGPITLVGVVGTFLTAGAAGLFVHLTLGVSWYLALLVGTAVAPTDPAVVFSVLGKRQISGRSGVILEGESGANDPVGIALMLSLLAAGALSTGALGHTALEFVLQMGVGAVVGVGGGWLLLRFMRLPLPAEGLYPLRTLASALVLYGAATLLHGSGFLAVFLAGIVLGDGAAPYKREVERFHSALASLGEIVAFVALGLTVEIDTLLRFDVWLPGLALGAVLAFVIRPLLVGLCLLPARLQRNENIFVLFSGLKGAVPILLGAFLLAAGVPGAQRLYGIVLVVVVFSVVVQGSLVPTVAGLLKVPMRTVAPEPWALGVRLRDEPDGVHRLVVAAGAPADGQTLADLAELPGDVWVSFLVRDQQLVAVSGDTRLEAGDDLLVLADPSLDGQLKRAFQEPATQPE